MKPKPILRFRVYPASRRSLYFTVIIWRTLKDLRTANPRNSHTLALCRCTDTLRIFGRGDKRPDRLKPHLGEVHFCRHHLRVGIIAHEFTHATIGWAARTRIIPDFTRAKDSFTTIFGNSTEERFCHALGNMVSQCVRSLYKTKLI